MWSTLISIAFTIAGCFALSEDLTTVKNVHWFRVEAEDHTSGEEFVL